MKYNNKNIAIIILILILLLLTYYIHTTKQSYSKSINTVISTLQLEKQYKTINILFTDYFDTDVNATLLNLKNQMTKLVTSSHISSITFSQLTSTKKLHRISDEYGKFVIGIESYRNFITHIIKKTELTRDEQDILHQINIVTDDVYNIMIKIDNDTDIDDMLKWETKFQTMANYDGHIKTIKSIEEYFHEENKRLNH